MFNPLLANVFAGNALVVKVSEYASWSSLYYGRAIKACLAAVGAPEDLVQIVHGYGEKTGAVIVEHPDVPTISFTGGTDTGASTRISQLTGPWTATDGASSVIKCGLSGADGGTSACQAQAATVKPLSISSPSPNSSAVSGRFEPAARLNVPRAPLRPRLTT